MSHWTSASNLIPFKERKNNLDLSIILTVMHLRDLLAFVYDFDEDYKAVKSVLNELQNYLDESYKKEFGKNAE